MSACGLASCCSCGEPRLGPPLCREGLLTAAWGAEDVRAAGPAETGCVLCCTQGGLGWIATGRWAGALCCGRWVGLVLRRGPEGFQHEGSFTSLGSSLVSWLCLPAALLVRWGQPGPLQVSGVGSQDTLSLRGVLPASALRPPGRGAWECCGLCGASLGTGGEAGRAVALCSVQRLLLRDPAMSSWSLGE